MADSGREIFPPGAASISSPRLRLRTTPSSSHGNFRPISPLFPPSPPANHPTPADRHATPESGGRPPLRRHSPTPCQKQNLPNEANFAPNPKKPNNLPFPPRTQCRLPPRRQPQSGKCAASTSLIPSVRRNAPTAISPREPFRVPSKSAIALRFKRKSAPEAAGVSDMRDPNCASPSKRSNRSARLTLELAPQF